ncbi:MAG: aminotransferase class I/II-fold pyridoxal phosphate-dependent enzyme [Alphaproteobacteria bacterium GM202ARS2]|nr:aminotransferase class I/II-fold pyridoxal phosphate-dependent enzyme [Alphaproteobacteria bacterium GM202ARS2]
MMQTKTDHFTDEDTEAAIAYLSGTAPRNSIFDRSGVVEIYENELAAFHGRKICILMSSGTAALYSAFFCVGIRSGTNVVGPALTFMTTVTPAALLGAEVRLVDCEAETCNISHAGIEEAIDANTRAIIFTNMFGHPCNVAVLREIASRHGLPLIEDNSLAIGAVRDGYLTGSSADLVAFSLGSTKLFSGGQGGGLLCDDPDYADRALLLGHFGQRAQIQCSKVASRSHAYCGYGLNFRMHVLAAAISRARFADRERLFAARRKRYEIVAERLKEFDALRLPVETEEVTRGAWQGYVVSLREPSITLRTQMIAALSKCGPFAKFGLYYPSLARSLSLYKNQVQSMGKLSGANQAERFSFSISPMTVEKIEDVESAADQLYDVLAPIFQ